MLCLEKIEEEDSNEQKDQNQQLDLPYGPKLAKIPDPEDIAKSKLIKSLDFNPKLSIKQRKCYNAEVSRNIYLVTWADRSGQLIR